MKTLVDRQLEKCVGNFSREEFVKMMLEDIKTTKVEYRKLSDIKAEERYQKDYDRFITNKVLKIQEIISNSYKKYKRERYRCLWVRDEIAKLPKDFERQYEHFGHDLQSFTYSIKPKDLGCRYICVKENVDIEHIVGTIYDESIGNKYFDQSTGWYFVNEDSSIRLKFNFSDKLIEDWKAEKSELAKDVAKFYENTTYWGD